MVIKVKVLQNIQVPTGNILIVSGYNGNLELVSLGDYGKEHNIVADFMGLNRDIQQVKHTKLLPLEKKWVITISTQYGCSMGCKFCDVPKVGPGINATFSDLVSQIQIGLSTHTKVKYTERLNIHFARMGEPTFNFSVLECARYLDEYLGDFGKGIIKHNGVIHPVLSTMMPKANSLLPEFIDTWTKEIKNGKYGGDAGLQLSINSTDNTERNSMFNNKAMRLEDIAYLMKQMVKPIGRKYTLNFAVAEYEVDAQLLAHLFNPSDFLIKLTPMHKTNTAIINNINTSGDYTTLHPYKEIKESCEKVGFDVLVFIASDEEDLGRITCGNAILSGTMPECNYTIIK